MISSRLRVYAQPASIMLPRTSHLVRDVWLSLALQTSLQHDRIVSMLAVFIECLMDTERTSVVVKDAGCTNSLNDNKIEFVAKVTFTDCKDLTHKTRLRLCQQRRLERVVFILWLCIECPPWYSRGPSIRRVCAGPVHPPYRAHALYNPNVCVEHSLFSSVPGNFTRLT